MCANTYNQFAACAFSGKSIHANHSTYVCNHFPLVNILEKHLKNFFCAHAILYGLDQSQVGYDQLLGMIRKPGVLETVLS